MRWSMVLIILLVALSGSGAQQWHHPLYLSGNEVWRQRIPITIRNAGAQDVAGVPVRLTVGTQAGELPLAETPTEAVRVTDAAGTEMLYAITGPEGTAITRGPIPAAATVTIPATVRAGAAAQYYLYCDNPAAWAVPDFLETTAAASPELTATVEAPERLPLQDLAPPTDWARAAAGYAFRTPVRVVNPSNNPYDNVPVTVNLVAVGARSGQPLDRSSLLVLEGDRPLPTNQVGDNLLFPATLPSRAMKTFYLYFNAGPRPANPTASYAPLLDLPTNLLRNGSFELGNRPPDSWQYNPARQRGAGTISWSFDTGLFGRRSVRLDTPQGTNGGQPGFLQEVPVQPGRRYLFAAWMKTRDVEGNLELHGRCRNEGGAATLRGALISIGPGLADNTDWTLFSEIEVIPRDCATFQARLTSDVKGSVWMDGALLMEVLPQEAGTIEQRPADIAKGPVVWPVNALVKVFREALPPRTPAPARISCARNEKEPLQLALRSPAAIPGVTVNVVPPSNAAGAALKDVSIGIVGYVPVDAPSAYYASFAPAWQRRIPDETGNSDGFAAFWPDPILPRATFDLAANQTQPIWLTVSVPTDAAPGDYQGQVCFLKGEEVIAQTPFTVHVWKFALDEVSHVKAIFYRRGETENWSTQPQTLQERTEQLWRLMADHRLCPGTVDPAPRIDVVDGQAVTDFTDFDRAAEVYFNQLKFQHAFTPRLFFGFGWANFPGKKFGETPYPGEPPYRNVDRAQLRPEYQRVYDTALKAFGDHLREKGWADKFVLNLADEPFGFRADVRAQLKALCDMVHAGDRSLPAYASIWRYREEWVGALDIMGLGHYGLVSPQLIGQLQQGGTRIWWTTDGQMCIDTPYCAVERLLPYYCFKYGAEAYEYFAIDRTVYDPWQFGWHPFIDLTLTPGEKTASRYHNGGGYLVYPGGPVGHDGPVTTVRLEQAREGVEDYEYLYLLSRANNRNPALAQATGLVNIPSAEGRYSTKILPRPDAVLEAREAMAKAIEATMR